MIGHPLSLSADNHLILLDKNSKERRPYSHSIISQPRSTDGSDRAKPITATEFAKSFGRYKEEAQREPVAITSYGRISGYFVVNAGREYEELRRLREFERRVYRLRGLPAEVAEAIKKAKMDSVHDPLNELLEEE
jgi:hypothetical protein